MPKPEEYKAIAAWGKHLRSFQYYIANEQRKAAEDDAPVNAIYKDMDGSWKTTDVITAPGLKEKIEGEAGI